MAQSFEQQLWAFARTYAGNPTALVNALKSLLENEIQTRNKEVEADLALRKCRKLHPQPSDEVCCFECAKTEAWTKYYATERLSEKRVADMIQFEAEQAKKGTPLNVEGA